jgi:hypothetical protein
VVRALERAWEAIRERHPQVPAAVVITGAGSGSRRGALRLGHFAASRWQLLLSDTLGGDGGGGQRQRA